MNEWLRRAELAWLADWAQSNEILLWWMAACSVLMFFGTLIAIPMIVVRIPADYFSRRSRAHHFLAEGHPAVQLALLIIANLLGVIFVIAGIAMLVLPGQGLLTIVIGLMLISFPGKYRLERWVISRPSIRNAINRMRRRSGRKPLILDD